MWLGVSDQIWLGIFSMSGHGCDSFQNVKFRPAWTLSKAITYRWLVGLLLQVLNTTGEGGRVTALAVLPTRVMARQLYIAVSKLLQPHEHLACMVGAPKLAACNVQRSTAL